LVRQGFERTSAISPCRCLKHSCLERLPAFKPRRGWI
jgi:hypothetical protein